MFKSVGIDRAHGKDEGVITEGYWLDGVYTVTKVHHLKPITEATAICFHDFAVTDDVFDYCIHCGEQQLVAKTTDV